MRGNPNRALLFGAVPEPTDRNCTVIEECPTDAPPMTAFDVDPEKNKVFDQLTVAEQLEIESYMVAKCALAGPRSPASL